MDRNINWNTNNGRHASSTNGSDLRFRTSEAWLNEMNDSAAAGVQIIELNSLDESRSSQEHPYENIQNMSHMWSYANSQFQDLEDSYKANRQARLKRRLRNKNLFTANDTSESEFGDSFYFNNKPDSAEDMTALNQEINFFTILNRHAELNLNSSAEDIEDADVLEATGEVVLENQFNDGDYEQLVAYDSEQDGAKRTIWIYSIKNRRLLAEDDFGLDNIPSQSISSDSCSPERVDEVATENGTHIGRVASPIPKTYIPRLDISAAATLPNVSEVTEPKPTHTSKDKYNVSQKPANGWILDKAEKHEVSKQNKATNIVNWMALSPRETRRRSRHSNADVHAIPRLLPVTEVVSHSDKLQKDELDTQITEDVISKASPNDTRSTASDLKSNKVESVIYGGDYNKSLQVPRIRPGHEPPAPPAVITEPIEKLDNCWIAEEEPKPQYEWDPLDGCEKASAEISKLCGDKLMAESMALLKPVTKAAFSPLTGSPFSIQVSLPPDSRADGPSLLQRCINCLKCCKYRSN